MSFHRKEEWKRGRRDEDQMQDPQEEESFLQERIT